MKLPSRKIGYRLAAVVILLVLLVLLFRPVAIRVDMGIVEKGSMQVSVDELGETRSHDRFVITAPVAGKLARIELHDGDKVMRDQVVAMIAPIPLSIRERREQLARISATESQMKVAEEQMRHGLEDLAQAKRESKRIQKLVSEGFLSSQMAEQARNAEITIANEVEAARYRVKYAAAEVTLAKSGLIASKDGENVIFKIHSPVEGNILRIADASERVVTAGTSLLTLGDLNRLEVVIQLLSTEAVKVQPGMPVILDGWGGKQPLKAIVRRIEPYAFTKVSALGIEEKRSNVIADFVDTPQELGDGYRVNAKIVIWAADNVNKVPASSLFRCANAWCTFVVENGMAKRREVKIGQRNAQEAEVIEGLAPGNMVVRHPSNQIIDGVKVSVE